MNTWIILAIAFTAFWVVRGIGFYFEHRKAVEAGVPINELSTFSDPSKAILKAYNALPEANRPYGDIRSVLHAYDVKYGIKEANEHFGTYDYDLGSRFSWECLDKRYGYSCDYAEYQKLNKAIKEIQKALDDQQKAIEIAGVQDGLEEAQRLMAELRREKEIITETTKELT